MGTVISRRSELFVDVDNGNYDYVKDYSLDSGLGGATLRMSFMDYDNPGLILLNDKRIKSIQAEIVLKSGFLSWNDLLGELFGFRKDYYLYRGDLESFEIIEEWTEDGKIMYVEPFFGT
jgi:hypothetical protein